MLKSFKIVFIGILVLLMFPTVGQQLARGAPSDQKLYISLNDFSQPQFTQNDVMVPGNQTWQAKGPIEVFNLVNTSTMQMWDVWQNNDLTQVTCWNFSPQSILRSEYSGQLNMRSCVIYNSYNSQRYCPLKYLYIQRE